MRTRNAQATAAPFGRRGGVADGRLIADRAMSAGLVRSVRTLPLPADRASRRSTTTTTTTTATAVPAVNRFFGYRARSLSAPRTRPYPSALSIIFARRPPCFKRTGVSVTFCHSDKRRAARTAVVRRCRNDRSRHLERRRHGRGTRDASRRRRLFRQIRADQQFEIRTVHTGVQVQMSAHRHLDRVRRHRRAAGPRILQSG